MSNNNTVEELIKRMNEEIDKYIDNIKVSPHSKDEQKNDKKVKAIMKIADAEKNGYTPTYEIVESDKKYRSAFCKPYIEEAETIQYIALNEDRTLFLAVDEDGLLKQLPFNFFIEVINPSLGISRIDTIVGTAVFVKIKKVNPLVEEIWDYEVTDIEAEDFVEIMKILNPQNQIRLYEAYKKQFE